MLRRLFLTLPLIFFGAFAFAGDEEAGLEGIAPIQLTAAQIEILLKGNTTYGEWSSNGYKQFFAESGMTMYIPEDGPPDQGRWRTNSETDRYESWWRSTNWTAYTIVMTNDGYAWVNGNTLEPFKVYQGKQVSW